MVDKKASDERSNTEQNDVSCSMRFLFRKDQSQHDGQVGILVERHSDPYEGRVVVYFDSVGVVMNSIESAALAAAIQAARLAHEK